MAVSLEQFMIRCPTDIEILSYTKCTELCKYRCRRCNQEHQDYPSVIYRRKVNCRCEGWSGSTSLEQFMLEIQGKSYRPLAYTAIKRRCAFECLDCGRIFDARPFDIRSGRSNCPDCKTEATIAEYRRLLREAYPHLDVIEYGGAHAPSLHRCTECSTEFAVSPIVTKNKVRRAGCPKCDHQSGGPKLKVAKFGDRSIYVQGYEDVALHYLERYTNINPDKLITDKVEGLPTIKYRFKGKTRTYYPDFYYGPKNRIVEVKSTFTLLSVDYRKTCAKAKACIKQGYEFKLLLVEVDKKTREFAFVYKVPKNWYELSRSELISVLCAKYPDKVNKLLSLAKDNPYVDANR